MGASFLEKVANNSATTIQNKRENLLLILPHGCCINEYLEKILTFSPEARTMPFGLISMYSAASFFLSWYCYNGAEINPVYSNESHIRNWDCRTKRSGEHHLRGKFAVCFE
jgi:hypothetical protein